MTSTGPLSHFPKKDVSTRRDSDARMAFDLVEILFDRMPMGIAVFDRGLILRRCNPTYAAYIDRYTPRTAAEVLPGMHLFDLAPGIENGVLPLLERVWAGETVRCEARRLDSGGITSYWDVVWSPLIEDGQVVGVVDVSADATERVLARRALTERVEERTRQLATLLDASHNLASTLDLEPLLGLTLEQLGEVVGYSAATVFTLEGSDLAVRAHRGPIPRHEVLSLRFPLAQAGANRAVIEARKPLIIDDIYSDDPLALEFRRTAGDDLQTVFGYIRSWVGVPLLVKQRVIGMLTLDHSEPNYYTEQRAEMAFAFANHAAVAIENARLYQEEQERRREAEQRRQVAEGLRDVLAILNSNRPLAEVLDQIMRQAGRLLNTDRVAIYRLQPNAAMLTIQAARGLDADYQRSVYIPLGEGVVGRAVLERRPVSISDVAVTYPPGSAFLRESEQRARALQKAGYRSLLAVPLMIKDEVYGGIVLYFPEPREHSPEELELAAAIADQAALAIENARLRDQMEQAAISAERSRLARDLHDAVTQTLFSASLIAEVLPRIWERDAGQGRARLEELRQLTRGALAEMRTLLLELRPAALVEAPFDDLVRQLAEATTGRARVPVAVTVEGEGELPPDVQIALYRIVQEALNNVARHSGATQAAVELRLGAEAGEDVGWVKLCISDNGCGFDPGTVSADHLGLGIMRERAEAIGATLTVHSKPGGGTRIGIAWSAEATAGRDEQREA